MTAGPGSRHLQHHSGNHGLRRENGRMKRRRGRGRGDGSQKEAVGPQKLQQDLQRRYNDEFCECWDVQLVTSHSGQSLEDEAPQAGPLKLC